MRQLPPTTTLQLWAQQVVFHATCTKAMANNQQPTSNGQLPATNFTFIFFLALQRRKEKRTAKAKVTQTH